ncbi:hypothetical protein GM921_03995 [Pedobacter sp. LMG 31464]|uniref:Uncharacterized protein n=1 Tax=Pedobacter planticolens TaxID=2679964 RepID=A0A923DVE3_9SPHI|nr:hypothetical protein [Pedobacter planticolens]MBB2144632.1 hypothetical protein [Pedobacter planticolens]
MIEVKLDIKAIPVPLRYQPIYKIIILLAILRYGTSRPYNSTFLKLHLYMWALRSEENYEILLSVKQKKRDTIVPWIFEPSLDKIVTLAVINGLCKREILSNELQIQIVDSGLELLTKIEQMNLFNEDIGKIKQIGIIPQTSISKANSNWEIF